MKNCLPRSVTLASLLILASAVPAQAQVPPQSKLFPLTPCRLLDTRLTPNGDNAGPVLQANVGRAFPVVGTCGIPVTARSVVLNVTAVNATAVGSMAIFPTGTASPLGATALSYPVGKARAANFIARLGTTGDLVIWPVQASGTVHLVLDVTGWFEDPPATPIATLQAFANIATWGSSPATIAHLRDIGINGWITEQMAIPPNYYYVTDNPNDPVMGPWPDTIPNNCTGTCQLQHYTMYPLQNAFFYNALYYPDQLRQRVAWALHKFLVISGQTEIQSYQMTKYVNRLLKYAFGDYRQLLIEMTVDPVMGDYLNMRTSTLQNPNENYARELMQLFTIGTVKLNVNGTPTTTPPTATYSQYDINELARVMTGWQLAAPLGAGISNYRDAMAYIVGNHDQGQKKVLCDWTDPLNPINCAHIFPNGQSGTQDVLDAVDMLMAHQNIAPYVATQLIVGLVTSNPSPAYVGRVAAVFNNNGSGKKGDLGATVKAVITDPDALAAAADPNFGALRDPAFFTIAVLRGLGANAANGTGQSDGVLAGNVNSLGQNVFNPDTVFGYYPAENPLPGSATLIGPEFGIQSALTALRRANLINTLVYSNIPVGTNNPNGTSLDLSAIATLAGNPSAMVQELNTRLCNGLLSASAVNTIVTAVNAVPATSPYQRAQQATYLVATSSQFQVER
jgi:uncharacterized protein (DUF1800 family)